MPLFDYEDEIITSAPPPKRRKTKEKRTSTRQLPRIHIRNSLLLLFILALPLPLWIGFIGIQLHFPVLNGYLEGAAALRAALWELIIMPVKWVMAY